jgi:hypothetical protein
LEVIMRLGARLILLPLVLGATFLAQGCAAEGDDIDNGFESDDPRGEQEEVDYGPSATPGAAQDAGAAAPSASNDARSPEDANRAIEEADIVKVEGNRLYALSRYGGLAVVDTTNPGALRMLGRRRLGGVPFEMYFRDGRAIVMMNDFGHYVRDEGSFYGRWVQTSEIVELDVSDPARITEVATYDVPGTIADSRLVGKALYVVTYENGSCYRCAPKPSTIVTSFEVGAAITKIDQLPFSSPNAGYSAWQRSVSATNERLYVAGPEWSWNGGAGGRSVIQVVDIKDPNGKLVKGADIPIAGQIQSRWQMDEHQGVLRVVSQHGDGWGPNGAVDPQVETFAVDSSSSFRKLGQTNLKLPKPESLRAVRFDGTRGYAITAERTDPLFTIDLSVPSAPKQAGELHMPGWITHLEPRGDRLVGFGFEDTTWRSRLAVSLFDVSDLTKPTLTKRVAFGTAGGGYAEDADRIHKSVQVLDDKGLVLVPFASRGGWDGATCAPGKSGIQLIDYSRNDLVLRGVAPQYGEPRRAIVTGDTMLGVSDRSVTTFSIQDRDNPTKSDEASLSNPAYRMVSVGASIASITNDGWSSEVMLSLVPKASPDDALETGKISLASLAGDGARTCAMWGSSWTAWYSARLFAHGHHVIVTVPVHTYDGATSSGKLVVGVVDVLDPKAPKLVAKTEIAMSSRSNGYGGFFDGYGFYASYGGAMLGAGDAIVMVGSKLAYLENVSELAQGAFGARTSVVHRNLHVVDLSAPATPVALPTVALGDSLGAFPLLVDGTKVVSSRWVEGSREGKVKFFLDRVELDGALPTRLSSVNTPGSVLSIDAPTSRLVTADYTKLSYPASDPVSCSRVTGGDGRYLTSRGTCTTVARTFRLVDADGTKLTVRNTLAPPSQHLGGLLATDDRLYVTHYPKYDYTNVRVGSDGSTMPRVVDEGGMWTLGGVRDGRLRIVNEIVGDSKWPLAARGSTVALYTESGLALYDTTAEAVSPRLVGEAKLRGYGYTSQVLLEDDRAVCAIGEHGMQSVALTR